ncbi:MAG TPA: hypothetical protein VFX51_22570 [Solirubrobacteraceae bacterium]|nr:hypothetical protein [Solirubrobacteraceae bacterium]
MLTLLATTLALAGATTLPATDVTNNSATLNGSLSGATTAHFEYGTTTNYVSTVTIANPSDGNVSAPTDILSPNTTYHFKLFSDAGDGQDLTFRTAPNPTPPGVSKQVASGVTSGGAHVSASLDPNGAETTYYFQYGRTTGYGTRTEPLTVSGTDPVTVEADLTGLRAYTQYHWRLFARNDAGRTPGADRTFRTGRLATALTAFSSRKVVPYGRGVMIGGRVSGAGVRGMTLALEQQRFPFDRAFAEVATTHAGEDGGYLFSVDHVRRATRFRVVSRTQDPVTSAVALVRSRPRTTIGVRLLSRKRARVSGTIKPAVTGELSLQRFTSAGWTQVRHRAITAATTFSFKVTRARRVNRAFRVIVLPARGAYVKATSKSVVVSRRPGRARGHRAAAG